MFCSNCGNPLAPGAAFCSNCGTRVVTAVPGGGSGAEVPPIEAAVSSEPVVEPSTYTAPVTMPMAPAAPTPAPAPPAVRYAGFWRRFWAVVLDGLILNIVTVPIGMMTAGPTASMIDSENISPEQLAALFSAYATAVTLSLIANWLYCALMESSKWQATLGKLALGMRVTDLSGRRINFARATGRFFAKMVSTLTVGIGYVIQVFTGKRQALHDLIAGTLIVRTEG